MFGGELAFSNTDVTEENDVVFLQVFWLFGKLFNVVGTIAGAELGVEEQAVDLDAGVTGEGVADEAVFPTGKGVDDENADVFGLS